LKKLLLFLLLFAVSFSLYAQQRDSILYTSEPFYIPVTKTLFYKLANRNIPVSVSSYGNDQSIVYINLHDDESSSVSAARSLLQKHGGLLIKIMNNGERLIRIKLHGSVFTFDPNRMFSKEGIVTSLGKFGNRSDKAVEMIRPFGEFILEQIPDTASCVIALHNNTDGGYSVKSYLSGGNMETDAIDVFYNPGLDPDDFCFTTDSLLFQGMKAFSFNSILQDNVNATKDGSLSIYFGELGRRYINVETQLGKENFYIEMLGKLLSILENQ
jgi:hypothetical protein